jgi:hypothetical protein
MFVIPAQAGTQPAFAEAKLQLRAGRRLQSFELTPRRLCAFFSIDASGFPLARE